MFSPMNQLIYSCITNTPFTLNSFVFLPFANQKQTQCKEKNVLKKHNESICSLKHFGEILLRVLEREVPGDVNICTLSHHTISTMYRGFNNTKYSQNYDKKLRKHHPYHNILSQAPRPFFFIGYYAENNVVQSIKVNFQNSKVTVYLIVRYHR